MLRKPHYTRRCCKNLPIVLRIEKSIFSIIYYICSLKHKKRNTSGRNYEVFLKIYFFILGLNINDARYPNINAALIPLPNSLLLAMALWKAGIPVELHVYPEGIHGLSLANELVECLDGRGVQEECTSWISLVDTWLDRLMKKEGEE